MSGCFVVAFGLGCLAVVWSLGLRQILADSRIVGLGFGAWAIADWAFGFWAFGRKQVVRMGFVASCYPSSFHVCSHSDLH